MHYYSIFYEGLPNYLTNEPIIKPKKYGKGHYRANDQQEKRAFNKRLAKRRTKNKASRKARKGQRR